MRSPEPAPAKADAFWDWAAEETTSRRDLATAEPIHGHCNTPCIVLQCSIDIVHKGLSAFFERGDSRRIPAAFAPRIQRILSDLDSAIQPRDMDLPGYRLHPLTGDRRGQWSVRVSGNWRIVFRFRDGEAVDVTLIDYH